MGWGAVPPCNVSFFYALSPLLAFFLGLGWLAVAHTCTGTSLIPHECAWVSHSITLAFNFAWQRSAAFTVSWFLSMEKWDGLRFPARSYNEK